MESQTLLSRKTTLVLDEDERTWLRSIMQNPMWVDDPEKEDPIDAKMRAIFWNALSE